MIEGNVEKFKSMNIDVWQKDNLGEGTTIVVLDEGFVPYEYMAKQVEVMTFGYDGTKDQTRTGHGTGVMSVGYEIAPKARIIFMPFNEVLSEQKHKMIDWILDNKNKIHAITMSLNFSELSGRKYFGRLKDCGIPFFVASGNDGENDGVNYPANEPFTIAIGGGYENSTYRYSNGGEELIAVTPLILGYRDDGEAFTRFGTSFNTPVASFAYLLYASWRERNGLPKLTNNECIEWIKENALDMVGNLDSNWNLLFEGFDFESGWGMFRLPSEIPQVDVIIEEPIEGDDDLEFKDMQGHWAEQYVDFVSEKGIMTGFPDETFKPDNVMTRAEVATVIARMLGFEIEKK
jgi:hypothetical protein